MTYRPPRRRQHMRELVEQMAGIVGSRRLPGGPGLRDSELDRNVTATIRAAGFPTENFSPPPWRPA